MEPLEIFWVDFLQKFDKPISLSKVPKDKLSSKVRKNEINEFIQYCLDRQILVKFDR